MLARRCGLKRDFIQKKRDARALVNLLLARAEGAAATAKSAELAALQRRFRATDAEFRALVGRNELLAGAAGAEEPPAAPTNDDLLGGALAAGRDGRAKLDGALRMIEHAKGVAEGAADALAADREKLRRAREGLDAAESEAAVSRKLLLAFAKRAPRIG